MGLVVELGGCHKEGQGLELSHCAKIEKDGPGVWGFRGGVCGHKDLSHCAKMGDKRTGAEASTRCSYLTPERVRQPPCRGAWSGGGGSSFAF